ncbi:acylneuraminate cytidylyltransferase family protein [Alphaproteobacteria bacterium]|nr:acylneuraminate cytidylyltransferase family protein [Alphaproteobacteria bacterium]
MLAIIPARRGSKEIKGKNIKIFNGKPLIAWTIEVLQKSKKIDHIIISTDDEKVVNICKNYNIFIPALRPKRLCKDNSLAIDVYKYCIKEYIKSTKKSINNFLVALPTSPLRTIKDINNSIKIFEESKPDSLISCTKNNTPVEWLLKINKGNKIKKIFNEINKKNNYNRQGTVESYIPNGSIYIFNYQKLLKNKSFYSNNTSAYIMPEERSVDIDNINDFKYAEFLHKPL